MTKTFAVTFQPSRKRVVVPRDTLVLDAAAQAGIVIDVPCGGQGRCGRCKVRVEEGEVSQHDTSHLTREQIGQGWVLSCTARVASDLSVAVPPRRERDKIETAASRTAGALRSDWPRCPAVRRIFLELAPPSLDDSATDFERLRRSLEKETGIENLSIGLPLMRMLPGILRSADWRTTAIVEMGGLGAEARLLDLRPGKVEGPLLGAAVDIGTTTNVVYLVDLNSGRLVGSASSLNKQNSRGEDVISRIVYSLRGRGLQDLQELVVQTINQLLEELSQKHSINTSEIYDMVAAGNTIMAHLFLGLSPRYIREEPYVPLATQYPPTTAAELGIAIHPNASIYCMPGVAAYVGGDITAGVLSSQLYKKDELSLFLDVGTNGEIVLGNSDFLMTDACSAGPAFEGAGIRCGMRATEGAIEDVRINSQTLEPTVKVIGKGLPQGICGSGMISALAEMLITGVVNKAGRIDIKYVESKMGQGSRARRGKHGAEYVIVWGPESGTGEDIVLTGVDLDNLIRAKGAIYAGIMVMFKSAGIDLDTIEEVLIGGAFGQHINVEQAIQIGLLPDLPWDRFQFLGNTSAWGAFNALLSRQARVKAEEIARKMTYLELVADNSFYEEFTAALFLPHTEIQKFPSVEALLKENSVSS